MAISPCNPKTLRPKFGFQRKGMRLFEFIPGQSNGLDYLCMLERKCLNSHGTGLRQTQAWMTQVEVPRVPCS